MKVYDTAGMVVGTGRLTGGTVDYAPGLGDSTCRFAFTVTGIPDSSDIYQVEISHRGEVASTHDEARSGLSLSLGS